jgi:hypothetical protein
MEKVQALEKAAQEILNGKMESAVILYAGCVSVSCTLEDGRVS